MLKWARESQGLSLEDIALKLNRAQSDIAEWETGRSAPTYCQLEDLAYKHYKRPLAVFFLPSPPAEPDIKQEFRTLPDFEMNELAADTRYQVRLGQSFQLSLKELNDGVNSAERKIFRDIKISVQDRIGAKAQAIRAYLGIDMAEQSRWHQPEKALKVLRQKVEDVGIYVFKHSFKQKEISGFCLKDEEFPLIYLNNSTAQPRQIFSLFHELAHLLLHVNGISKVDFRYIESLPPHERRIEQFCNALAAEVLVPSGDFDIQIKSIKAKDVDDPLVEMLATRYCVSREAVYRKLLDRGLVSPEDYAQKVRLWNSQLKMKSAEKGHGNYYNTQGAYLSQGYLQLVFSRHYQGRLSLEQVADYLGVKTGNVAGLDVLVPNKGGRG